MRIAKFVLSAIAVLVIGVISFVYCAPELVVGALAKNSKIP